MSLGSSPKFDYPKRINNSGMTRAFTGGRYTRGMSSLNFPHKLDNHKVGPKSALTLRFQPEGATDMAQKNLVLDCGKTANYYEFACSPSSGLCEAKIVDLLSLNLAAITSVFHSQTARSILMTTPRNAKLSCCLSQKILK